MDKETLLKMSKEDIDEFIKEEIGNDDCDNCINCYYCDGCADCKNCGYCDCCERCENCYECYNCTNCYKCEHKRNCDYMILNIQLTKEEYEKKMKELNILRK